METSFRKKPERLALPANPERLVLKDKRPWHFGLLRN
jgi:hypothetical protein